MSLRSRGNWPVHKQFPDLHDCHHNETAELGHHSSDSWHVSWHETFKESNWICIRGLPNKSTKEDIISLFSRYGDIENIEFIYSNRNQALKFCFLSFIECISSAFAEKDSGNLMLHGQRLLVDHVNEMPPPCEEESQEKDANAAEVSTDNDNASLRTPKKQKKCDMTAKTSKNKERIAEKNPSLGKADSIAQSSNSDSKVIPVITISEGSEATKSRTEGDHIEDNSPRTSKHKHHESRASSPEVVVIKENEDSQVSKGEVVWGKMEHIPPKVGENFIRTKNKKNKAKKKWLRLKRKQKRQKEKKLAEEWTKSRR